MTQQEFIQRYTYSVRTDKLGGGAFGTVYKAYDNTLNKYVAIKIAEVKTINGKEFSLLDEFKAIKGLPAHPNIANYDEVYTFDQPTGVYDYAIIQYYPDGNLSDLIKSQKLSFQEKEDIALQILEGLAFLHEHKVVHRDMKPSNILIHKHDLTGQFIPKIADFGLSKKANTDQSRFTNSFGGGTFAYSSPEQLREHTLKFNTDLWAWAVMTYELFTGKPLFAIKTGSSSGAEREKELFEDIINKDISQDLKILEPNWQNALQNCLIRDNEDRVKDVASIKNLLNIKTTDSFSKEETKIINDKTEIKSTPPIQEHTKQSQEDVQTLVPKKNNDSILYLIIGVLILLLLGGGFWYVMNQKKQTEKTIEEKISTQEASESIEKELTYSQAKERFIGLHDIQISGDLQKLDTVFATQFNKYYDHGALSYNQVLELIRNYQAKFKENEMELLNFTDQGNSTYLFEMKYVFTKRKTGEQFKKEIKGYLGFIRENGVFKINTIYDISNEPIDESTSLYPQVDETLSDNEISQKIKRTLDSYFYYDDNEKLESVLSSFSYPVKRYFDQRNVSYSKLKKIYNTTNYKIAYKHEHEIDWSRVKWEKNTNGYVIYLKGNYYYSEINTRDIKSHTIDNIMKLNKNFKITHYYK